jgi:hypothetical protein
MNEEPHWKNAEIRISALDSHLGVLVTSLPLGSDHHETRWGVHSNQRAKHSPMSN